MGIVGDSNQVFIGIGLVSSGGFLLVGSIACWISGRNGQMICWVRYEKTNHITDRRGCIGLV